MKMLGFILAAVILYFAIGSVISAVKTEPGQKFDVMNVVLWPRNLLKK